MSNMKEKFIYKKITTLILILSFVLPATFLTVPSKTHAFGLDTIGGPSNIINVGFSAISAGFDAISSVAQTSLAFKEYVLDPLTVLLREVLISNITKNIVNWINGGFEGEPAFITDLGGFLTDIGDEVLGSFIEADGNLAGLCKPFRADVRIALALDYYSRDDVSCTLSDVLGNVSDAFGDLSSKDAWDQWYQLSINPNNNAVGSFLSARNSIRLEQASKQDVAKQVLGWGNGFQSYEVCDDPATSSADDTAPVLSGTINGVKLNCRIATPGIIINKTLGDTLGTGYRQLELADEINEIIGALLGQLVKQVLGGPKGLSGLSQSYNGQPAYIDRLVQESRDSSSISDKTLEAIQNDLQKEGDYRYAKQASLGSVKSAIENIKGLYQCYVEKAAQKRTLWGIVGEGNNKSIVSFTSAELTANANSASSTIASTLVPLRDRLMKDIVDVDDITSKLIVIKTDLENVESLEDLNEIIGRYQTLKESEQIKTVKDVYDSELERDGYPGEEHGLAKGIIRDMATLNSQTSASLEACQSLVLTQQPFISTGN